ncbi:MAG: hypothetical protein ACTHKR_13800 [Sphingomonas sp.]
MSLKTIHLRKLLKIIYSAPNRRISALRSDIREEISREAGESGAGGDFYVPFWSDAKAHVFDPVNHDLHTATDNRLAANYRRANLYPRLRDGFLLWWNDRRRWHNEPYRPAKALKTRFPFPGIDAEVKIDNILSVRDAAGENHFVYPYFSPDPVLNDEAARLALWLLSEALPTVDPQEIRVLDVIRGQTFSIRDNPLRGNEQEIFSRKYAAAIAEWEELRREYE